MVSMLKRGVTAPVSVSNDTAVVIDVGEEVVEDLRPLVYHFFKVNKQNKTIFMVNTYDKELFVVCIDHKDRFILFVYFKEMINKRS